MSYPITKDLTNVNKGKKGDNVPEWIIIHFVGAKGQAKDNANYFRNTYRGASAQYFVDPKNTIQVVEDDTPAWHIGDGSRTRKGKNNGYVNPGGATNTNSIGIEGCQDVTTGKDVWHWDFHPDTVKRIEALVRDLQKKYNIDDDHVIRHFDASGKVCPGNWQHNSWAKWHGFKARLEKDVVQPAPKGNSNSEGKQNDSHMYLVQPGDTLYGIAKDNNTTVDKLVSWNDLDDKDLIFPETKLFVKEPKVDEPITDIDKLARDVIAGKYGVGAARKKVLGKNFNEVQRAVNIMLLGKKSGSAGGGTKSTTNIDKMARDVIDGKYGTGDERKRRLGKDYAEVQKRVNQMLNPVKQPTPTKPKPRAKTITQLAKEVIDGKHGVGDARKKSLGKDYGAVQRRVNELLGAKKTQTSKTISQLADEVMAGKHGTGSDRMRSLGANYAEVQMEVNRRLR